VKDVLEICGIYAGFDRDSAGRRVLAPTQNVPIGMGR
jgi:hypothetical protein